MRYLFISLSTFFIILIIHIILHRLLTRSGLKTIKSSLIYILGFLILLYVYWFMPVNKPDRNLVNAWHLPLPLTGLLLYTTVSLLNIMLFTSPLTGNYSPSVEIFLLVERFPGITLARLLKHFPDKKLINDRLDNFVKLGFVIKSGNVYQMSEIGNRLMKIIDLYRNLCNWKSSG